MLELAGVVCRVRFGHGKREYTLTDGKDEFRLFTDENLAQGSCIKVQGEMSAGGMLAERIIALEGSAEKETLERVKAAIRDSAMLPGAPVLFGGAAPFWEMLRDAAGEALCARKLGRSVLVRFHGDADGIASAIALTGILRAKALQQNSAVYSVRDALRDLAFIGQESRPLVILLDFGSSSKEGLGLLRAAGVDYLVIDHHPYEDKENPSIINPLRMQPESSKFCAGYLSCEVAAMCGMRKEDAMSWARVACAGDKSDILGSGPEDARKAMVLDFLASHVAYGNSLEFYQKVMGQEELFGSIAEQAEQSIEEAALKAISRMKKAEGKVEIAYFSLEGIAKRGEWPPSSKITTRVFDKLAREKPLVCIGYTERSLIMRLNDGAVASGLSANSLAESMKGSMGDFVEGGGGHAKAGAIRAKEGFVKEILNQLIDRIQE